MSGSSAAVFLLVVAAVGAAAALPVTDHSRASSLESLAIPPRADVVDASSLRYKLMLGYQGWFHAPHDGSPQDGWFHWFQGQTPDAAHVRVDFYPDLREFDDDELFETQMHMKDGSRAKLYSSSNPKTIDRHFKWMRDAGIDGVWLQRFLAPCLDQRFNDTRTDIARHVAAAAAKHGRVWGLMYDVSGFNPEHHGSMIDVLQRDFAFFSSALGLAHGNRYIHEHGKPAVVLWGLGFKDRPGTADEALNIVHMLQRQFRVHLIGGVPTAWRTLDRDSKTDPAWLKAYTAFDVIQPWLVGRFGNMRDVDAYVKRASDDIAYARTHNVGFMPVVYPGFSWHNMHEAEHSGHAPFNQIPRLGGSFYWYQNYLYCKLGVDMVFNAMFDEVDEGTAMMKTIETPAQGPVDATFVALDADGISLPSDWYLRLAGQASRMLRRDFKCTKHIPIKP